MTTCPCGIAKIDCDYHKPEFEPISDGSVIYSRYDEVNKIWNRVHWTAAIETDHCEYTLTPA